ncbi:hypothetical protein [Bdellovibrio sp. HCB337]|uniref:hypothetical protein n=1 Tax=Bdellovibrio sp. HCB337 TaxID=3394358 RepID=UPI0039A4228A
MKRLLVMTLLAGLTVSSAFARTTMITGRANEFGYCSYNQGRFCIDRIADRAERAAERDADWRCRSSGGKSSLSPFCSSSCNPSFLPPGNQSTPVRCNASCTVQCETPN